MTNRDIEGDLSNLESIDSTGLGLMQNCSPTAFMTSRMRRNYLQVMLKNLPKKIQNRVVALKNLQLGQLEFEAEFNREVYDLEKKYYEKAQSLFEQRRDIVTGDVDPPEQEPKWKEQKEDEIILDMTRFAPLMPVLDEDSKGIPNFWLTVFRNIDSISEIIQTHDEPVLQKLRDIQIKYHDDEEPTFTLEFYFDKNDYFSDAVLTKQYFLKKGLDEDSPFAYDGLQIFRCKGCPINWEEGMNLTIKTIRKKQKHRDRGSLRTITRQVPNETFFNFFSPPTPDESDEIDEESQRTLFADFEIGHSLRVRVVPKAVLCYTGEVDDNDEDDDEDEEDDDDDEGDDDNNPIDAEQMRMPNQCPNQ